MKEKLLNLFFSFLGIIALFVYSYNIGMIFLFISGMWFFIMYSKTKDSDYAMYSIVFFMATFFSGIIRIVFSEILMTYMATTPVDIGGGGDESTTGALPFINPTTIAVIIVVSVFAEIMWAVYGEKYGKAFKMTAMLISLTPPVTIFIYVFSEPDITPLAGSDIQNILESIDFAPLQFLIRGIIALIYFVAYLIIAITVSVIGSLLKSYIVE